MSKSDWLREMREAKFERGQARPAVTESQPSVTNRVTNTVTNRDVGRVLRWRAKNQDRYRAYQRAYMAKRRQEARRAG
jgi:hypothetical protein